MLIARIGTKASRTRLAHVYTDDADTTCNVCGYKRTVTPPAHSTATAIGARTARTTGTNARTLAARIGTESIQDKAAHVYTDDADTTCNVCGYERTITPPAHEHRYGDWRKDGTNHWHECTDTDCPNRNESIQDKAAHVSTPTTQIRPAMYAATSAQSRRPAHEHSYGDWRKDGTSHWHECTDADCPNRNESIQDKAAHIYTDDTDTTCNVCGYERTITPPAHECIVTFDGNGGTPSVGSMTTTNRKLTSLPSASQSKHSFDGWYTERAAAQRSRRLPYFSANTTVYAHWTYIGGSGGYNPPSPTTRCTLKPAPAVIFPACGKRTIPTLT